MKYLTLTLALLTGNMAFAGIDFSQIEGSWSIKCTQSQASGKQGFILETYTFTPEKEFKFTRNWFKKSGCEGTPFEKDTESGKVKLGEENTNNGFNPAGTHEADFTVGEKTDLGLIWVNSENSKLRITRGSGMSSRNTMLSLFEFTKSK